MSKKSEWEKSEDVGALNAALREQLVGGKPDRDSVLTIVGRLNQLGARPNPTKKAELPDGLVVVLTGRGGLEQKTVASAEAMERIGAAFRLESVTDFKRAYWAEEYAKEQERAREAAQKAIAATVERRAADGGLRPAPKPEPEPLDPVAAQVFNPGQLSDMKLVQALSKVTLLEAAEQILEKEKSGKDREASVAAIEERIASLTPPEATTEE